jgi:ABC-type phosphate transport system permease subunit
MPDSKAATKKAFNVFDSVEKPTEWLIRLCGWSSIIGIAAIFLFIFKEAAPMVPRLDWFHLFTSPRWIPNPAPGLVGRNVYHHVHRLDHRHPGRIGRRHLRL